MLDIGVTYTEFMLLSKFYQPVYFCWWHTLVHMCNCMLAHTQIPKILPLIFLIVRMNFF